MAKIKKHYTKGFTVIKNSVIQDIKLSWKARGIFLYLWSQPDDWNFYVNEVYKHSSDGRDSLRSGLEELERHGYVKRQRLRTKKGCLGDSCWSLYEDPTFNSPTSENTTLDKPTLQNTNQTKYQLDKKLTRDIYSSSSEKPPKEEHHIPYQEIIDYLNQKAGTEYRATTKATKTLIKARWNEGNTLDDFKKVIDNQAYEWQGTKFWKYMRPATLFASKFEGYLNANVLDKEKELPHGGFDVADEPSIDDLPDDLPF